MRVDGRAEATAEVPAEGSRSGEAARIAFRREDLVYRHMIDEPRPQSNAVVICIMDTSGSMDTDKKYLARSFFFLLHRFVKVRYDNVEVVFISHATEAREVDEEEFFHKGESGGTMISSGYRKALEIIEARYSPELGNVYAFHSSDGDNSSFDDDATVAAVRELAGLANLVGYGEIKPHASYGTYRSSTFERLAGLGLDNFAAVSVRHRSEVWPAFRELLSRDRAEAIEA